MRKLIVSEFLTLDGVMQAPGLPDEDRSGGFEHGGWQQAYFDAMFGDAVTDTLAETGALVLGRRTYQIFAAFWPNQPAGAPLAETLNALPKHVVSTTLTEPLGWQNSSLVRGDVADGIARLKAEPGKAIQVIGSGELVEALIRHDLVDEYRLMIHPLVLGSGKRLFREVGEPLRLKLVDAKPTTTGVLILTYEPVRAAGEAADASGAAVVGSR